MHRTQTIVIVLLFLARRQSYRFFCKNYKNILTSSRAGIIIVRHTIIGAGQIYMALPETLTASQILAIGPTEPERLFSGDPASLRHEFAVLAKSWHPDRNGSSEAAKVLERVVALHDAASTRNQS
jgi:hypothetical protein